MTILTLELEGLGAYYTCPELTLCTDTLYRYFTNVEDKQFITLEYSCDKLKGGKQFLFDQDMFLYIENKEWKYGWEHVATLWDTKQYIGKNIGLCREFWVKIT